MSARQVTSLRKRARFQEGDEVELWPEPLHEGPPDGDKSGLG